MNAISKKLLSMLVVVAMVLSMVPFGGLSIFAVETEATEVASSTVTPGQANLSEGISTTNPVDNSDTAIAAHITAGTCPMCGATDITWARQTGGGVTVNDQEGATKHVYFDTNFTTTGNLVQVVDKKDTDGSSKNVTICIALKSTAAITCSKYRVQIAGTDATNVVNIMGTGSLHSDQTIGGTSDVGLFQVDKGTLNLYGGTYTHTTNQDATNDTNAVIRINNSVATVNMYDGVVVGPETVDTTKWGHNVRVDGGTFNMYGGTIRNGVSKTNGISGNVTIANSGKMYMYGGTISGGNYSATGTVGGNVVVGGFKQAATSSSVGSFYMYGGTITGGSCANDENGGGNIVNYNGGGDMHLLGGIIENGNATWGGGNVSVQEGTATKNVIGGTVLIRNGTITGNNGANVLVKTGLTMSGGFIQGDSTVQKTGNGGGIYLSAGATLNMTGGEISNMNVAGDGGGIYAVGSATTVNISDSALLKGNCATSYGGNIHLSGATLTMEGGTVSGGYAAAQGGNISGGSNSQINISGGTVSGGSFDPDGDGWGGNIRAYNATVNISGGYIYDGCIKNTATNRNAGNIGALGTSTLNISGGNIGGDIQYTNGNVKLSGAPKIKHWGLKLADGTTAPDAHYNGIPVTSNSAIDISGLTSDAEIQVTGDIGAVFTVSHANAADVVGCFISTANTTKEVTLTDDGMQLQIVEKVEEPAEPEVGVFAPWDFEGQAYCPVCYANGDTELKTWTAYSGTGKLGDQIDGAHLYLSGNRSALDENQALGVKTDATVCFNLNGKTLSMDGRISLNYAGATLNIMDTSADGTGLVTTTGTRTTAGYNYTVNVQKAATLNLYGGTYKNLNTNNVDDYAVVRSTIAGANINIKEGVVIDGGNVARGILLTNGTVRLQGGTVMNGSAENGGNIKATGGTVEMTAGKIYGGNSTGNGGNITLENAKMNMSGGEIYGGEAANQGGNFRIYKGDLNMSGTAVIKDGTANNHPNIWLVCSDMTMTDNATVYGSGTAAGNAINVAAYGVAGENNTIISTLTLSGNATVKAKEGTSRNSIALSWTLNKNADATDDAVGKLMIDNGWTGEAYVTMTRNDGVAEGETESSLAGYNRGETIAESTGYCGELQADGTVTKGGSFTGKLYYGPQNNAPILGVEGDLIVPLAIAVAADGTQTGYTSNQEAVDAVAGNLNAYALMGDEATVTLSGDTIIESRGYDVTVNGDGNGNHTLYALDYANDDYVGYGEWTLGEGVTIAEEATNPDNGNRYISLKNNDGSYGVHRIEIELTHVTLRTSEAGLYYKASYKCDGTLAGRVSAYGVAVSTNVTPGKDFLEDYTNNIGFSCLENFPDVHETTGENAYTVKATSGSVFGILKTAADGRDISKNDEYGKMKIYANSYFVVDRLGDEDADNDYVTVGDLDNGGKTTETAGFDGVAYSLHDALTAIDGMWNQTNEDGTPKLSDAQKEKVVDFCLEWMQHGLTSWAADLPNISAAAAN